MNRFRRLAVVLLFFTSVVAAPALAGQGAAVTTPRLTDAEMEKFLLTARISDTRDAGAGVTDSIRATLSDGTLTHDAHVQSVDISRPVFRAGTYTEVNFKDSYRFNIAAYRLARLLQLSFVPVSVERDVNGKTAAVSWWVDGVEMDEKARLERQTMGPNPRRTSNQIAMMYIWDELIQNRDRNTGNIVWTDDWTMWLIDHTRAFRLDNELLKPERLVRCDRRLLAQLKLLTDDSLARALGESLTKGEREAILNRRDRIVKIIDDRVAQFGQGSILFDR